MAGGGEKSTALYYKGKRCALFWRKERIYWELWI